MVFNGILMGFFDGIYGFINKDSYVSNTMREKSCCTSLQRKINGMAVQQP